VDAGREGNSLTKHTEQATSLDEGKVRKDLTLPSLTVDLYETLQFRRRDGRALTAKIAKDSRSRQRMQDRAKNFKSS
jgi:hypothetical protein